MSTEEGVVTQVGPPGIAQVKTVRSSACKACSARHSCKPGESKEMEVTVIDPVGVKPGDRVLLTLNTGNLLKATFLLYILPIVGLLAGAVLGNHWGHQWGLSSGGQSGLSALLGFVGLAIAVLFVRWKGNQLGRNKEYRPRISRILKPFAAKVAIQDAPQAMAAPQPVPPQRPVTDG